MAKMDDDCDPDRINVFSNPDVTYENVATGVASTINNAQTIRDNMVRFIKATYNRFTGFERFEVPLPAAVGVRWHGLKLGVSLTAEERSSFTRPLR